MRLCYSLVMLMALLMLTSGAGLIAGCGKKGPLYHPGDIQQQPAEKKKSQTSQPQANPDKTDQ